MSRRVYSAKDIQVLQKEGKPTPVQDLNQKIINYIPVEIVTAWTVMYGVLNSLNDAIIYWVAFLILGILIPIYIWRFTSEDKLPFAYFQMIGATGAYISWVFAMGGPFTKIEGFTYNPQYGTLVLAIYSVILIILLGKTTPSTGNLGTS